MIHITHIIQGLQFGGAERTVVDLINRSDPQKFRYSIIVLSAKIPLAAEITRPGVSIAVVEKKGKFSFGLVRRLVEKLRELKPDIVHTHIFAADVWGKIAAHRAGIPIITTEHNVRETEGLLRSVLKSLFLSYADKYIACSESVSRFISKRYHLKRPIAVIRPGIDLKRFEGIEPHAWHRPVKIVTIGRLDRQKGHSIALQALARITDISWEYSIVGEGPLQKKLRRMASKLKIAERVRFYPPTHNIPSVFRENDIVLIPSRWEGLGIVALEAQAAGRLVVAADVDGLPEALQNGRTGLLFAPKKKDLAETLSLTMKKEAECLKIAAAAREYARKNFGVEQMTAAYEREYEILLQKYGRQ